MKAEPFILYAWRLSWYSAKVRSYLQNKGIPYVEKRPTLYTLKRTIPAHCAGAAAVPVVVTPEDEWWQDSTLILDNFERRFPQAAILPDTPVQRLFCLLVELWADEFWHPTAEHYRFSFPQNLPIWRDELSTLLPGFPQFLKQAVVGQFYKFMLEVTRLMGVIPEQTDLIESWSEAQLDALDRHLATLPYLLGSRASLADFSLMGPINGHLAHDPCAIKTLIEPRPHLKAWIARMSTRATEPGVFLPGDQLPETLLPVIRSLFGELLPYLERCASALPSLKTQAPGDPRLERIGPMVDMPFGDGRLKRIVHPYVLWMLQRVQDHCRQLPEHEASQVKSWLAAHGGERLLDLPFARLRRFGLHVAPEVALHNN